MGQIYEQRKDYAKLKQHFTEYLKNWAAKGGIDRQITAEVKLGEIAWRESCPVPGVNGACIDIKRERASSATLVAAKAAAKAKKKLKTKGPLKLGQCGPETKSKITVHDRKPALCQRGDAALQEGARPLQGWRGGQCDAQGR